MNFKNLKFSLATTLVEKPEPIIAPDYKPWNILSPEYLEDAFPLHVGNAALIFFAHIGATNDEKKDDGCGCGSCHVENISNRTKRAAPKHHNGKDPKELLKEIKLVAESKGWKCLSTEWVRSDEALEFECIYGHRFYRSPGNVRKDNSVCPYCTINICEETCRVIIEEMTGLKFPRDNSTLGDRLQLDGYCEELNIAFEHHGKQHYEHIPFFNRTEDDFKKQQARDAEKIIRCRKSGIQLIEIPYTKSKKRPLLAKFIYSELINRNIPVIKKLTEINLATLKVGQSQLEELKCIAKAKRGTLFSDTYMGATTMMFWGCDKEHTWWMTAHKVKDDNCWCPMCAIDKLRNSIEEIQSLAAAAIGGKFISTKYVNNKTYYKWRCGRGHILNARSTDIARYKNGCPECNRDPDRKPQVIKLRELAISKGGEFLSPDYSCHIRLKWKCRLGHKFTAKSKAVLAGSWCPQCEQLEMVIKMQEIAKSRGGLFLSTTYTTSVKLHQWQCEYGNIWAARPANISRGQWCPCVNCAGVQRQSVEDMHNLANQFKGLFLSTEYVNNKTLYQWKCHRGHVFWKKAIGVTNGQWCRECDNIEKSIRMKEWRRKQKEEKQNAEQFLELQGIKTDNRRKRKSSRKEENQKNNGIIVKRLKKTKAKTKRIYNNGYLLARYLLQPLHLNFQNEMINDMNQHFCGEWTFSGLDLSNDALLQRVLDGQKPMAIICERDNNLNKYLPLINEEKFEYKIADHEKGFTYLVVAAKGKMKDLFDLDSLQKDYSNSKISIDVRMVANKNLSYYFDDWDSEKVERWETGLILGYPIENTISIYRGGANKHTRI